jgi:ketosteroid isomerase-like protein
MSQERQWPSDWRSRIEALADALNARDFEAVGRAPLEPELEWRSVLAASEGGSYRGVEGLRQWSENVDAIWDAFRLELSELHEADESRTVTVYRTTGRAKASGVPLDARVALVWTWRRGKVCGIVSYTNPDEALEAAGLRE